MYKLEVLHNDNYEALDLGEDKITLDLKSSFFAFETIDTSRSLPFSLPASRKNKRLLQFFHNMDNRNKPFRIPTKLYLNLAEEGETGELKVKWTGSKFDCTLFLGLGSIASKLKVDFTELDLGVINFTFSWLRPETQNENDRSINSMILTLEKHDNEGNILSQISIDSNDLVTQGTFDDDWRDWEEINTILADASEDWGQFTFSRPNHSEIFCEWTGSVRVDRITMDVSAPHNQLYEFVNGNFHTERREFHRPYILDNLNTNHTDGYCLPFGLGETYTNDEDGLDYYENINGFIDYESSKVIPCLFISYILRKLGEALGISIKGFFEESTAQKLCFLGTQEIQNFLYFQFNEQLPVKTPADFLKELTQVFCLTIQVNEEGLLLSKKQDEVNRNSQIYSLDSVESKFGLELKKQKLKLGWGKVENSSDVDPVVEVEPEGLYYDATEKISKVAAAGIKTSLNLNLNLPDFNLPDLGLGEEEEERVEIRPYFVDVDDLQLFIAEFDIFENKLYALSENSDISLTFKKDLGKSLYNLYWKTFAEALMIYQEEYTFKGRFNIIQLKQFNIDQKFTYKGYTFYPISCKINASSKTFELTAIKER
ncbi:hypothetical protein [Flammeovirga pacifica]|nr:hypothetical protein [Flammeovirga pacifica]